MHQMTALICPEPKALCYSRRDVPRPAPGEALLRVLAVGICGTDIHAWAGNQPFFSYPRVLGHEVCGEIVETGDNVTGFRPGQRVALIPYLACGTCPACSGGKPNCCERISVIGVHQDGAFCEFISVPVSNLLPVGDLNPEAAALLEPFAISAHAVRRAALRPGQAVLVSGAGPIGLGVAAIADADGAQVVVSDTSAERRAHVTQVLGLPALNPMDAAFQAHLRGALGGLLPETVIDATGSPQAMNGAVTLIRHGGSVVFVGLHKGMLEIADPEFHKREATVMGSRNATREDFANVSALMAAGTLHPGIMLTHHFQFSTLAEEFDTRVIGNRALIKGIVRF
ncbi:zinc-binding alcohol dehydrogenase family protein [Chimaeribacter arupi]|uniref:zinc-binding alcohol dehydrogenase family protein n=1 Tax=Chimaeribacter arupi TaxID=2060066 RepID=UPI000C79A7BC|nr:zinc-binding alcohol dehydrogenase family protein [Chimaeribacter arupi]PLR44704.1 galactonate oxidoreductase [Chimaeribacter arupi]WKZ93914.1 zinc-binding alcohol dehydrogenase family protein [Chimaeribacter arupi]